ncbi:MAG: WD40 repeat domain-containing protein [Planctomycetes bacterium]|nr:WD40 repeat domain-containing protein [Planctomycetota bacterium]
MLRWLGLVGVLAVIIQSLSAGESPQPGRVQIPAGAKGVSVVSVWGEPEQQPALGHTTAMTPNGKFALYSGGGAINAEGGIEDGFLTLWDVESGRLLKELKVPRMAVTALAISADAKLALTGSLTGDAKSNETHANLSLWDLEAGKLKRDFGEQMGEVAAVAFSGDGKRALVSTLNDAVSFWDLEKPKPVAKLPSPKNTGAAFALAFHPDGDKVLAGQGTDLVVWSIETGKEVHRLKGHEDTVLMADVSKDGKRAVTSGADASIKLWDIENGAEIGAMKKEASNRALTSIAFVDHGRKILSIWTGFDAATGTQPQCEVSLWDGETKKTLWSQKSHFKGFVPLAIVEEGKAAIMGGGANFFARWNLADGKEERLWGGHKGPVNALAVDGEGTAYSGSADGTIKAWVKGRVVRTFTGHADAVNALALSKDGQFLVSGSADKTVKLWDAGKGRVIKTFAGHAGNVTGVAISPDFQWIVSGGNDRTVKIWDIVSAKERENLAGHAEGINCVALSPDASWLASASDDNTIRLWPLKDGKADPERGPLTLEEHKRQATCVAFSPDGKQLISGSQDKTLKLWDVGKAKVLKSLEGHKNWVSSITFAEGGKLAISTSDDFTVRVWDVASGQEVGRIDLSANSDCPRSLAYQGGRRFVVGTSGWMILGCRLNEKTKNQ